MLETARELKSWIIMIKEDAIIVNFRVSLKTKLLIKSSYLTIDQVYT